MKYGSCLTCQRRSMTWNEILEHGEVCASRLNERAALVIWTPLRLAMPLAWRWPWMSLAARGDQLAVDLKANRNRAARPDAIDEYVDLIVKRAIGHYVETYLDIGAGTGRYTSLVKAQQYWVNEPHTPTWEAGQWTPGTERILGDCLELEARDATCDLVTCYHVLHHVAPREMALREIVRVLKPHGQVLIIEPRHTWRRALRLLYYWATEYRYQARTYPTHDFLIPSELPALCRTAGLKIVNEWVFPDRVAILARKP